MTCTDKRSILQCYLFGIFCCCYHYSSFCACYDTLQLLTGSTARFRLVLSVCSGMHVCVFQLCFRTFCALLHICGQEIQRWICVCTRDHTEEARQPNVLRHHTQNNGAALASPPLFLKTTVSLTPKHTGHMIYFCFAKCFLLDSGKYSADATALHLAAAASPALALAAPLVLLWAPAASILR